MPETIKTNKSRCMNESAGWKCVMPASKKTQKSFQRMITPNEMIREMKKISQTKSLEDEFFRKIGINISPISRTKKER